MLHLLRAADGPKGEEWSLTASEASAVMSMVHTVTLRTVGFQTPLRGESKSLPPRNEELSSGSDLNTNYPLIFVRMVDARGLG